MKRLPKPVEELSAESGALYKVLNEESDLACVVIGSAFLDAALGTLLSRKLITSNVADKLLEPSGALGSFATRADIAYCLGIIDKSYYQDLCTILRIRNQFAHSHLQLGFHDPSVREECERLHECFVLISPEKLKEGSGEAWLTRKARTQFNLSVVVIANGLLVYTYNQKTKLDSTAAAKSRNKARR